MALTIRDIAELAGVSRGTVDRVLHNRGRVDPAVSARVFKIMESCNYRPSKAAQQLALMQKKRVIGYISKYDHNGFWSIVNKSAKLMAKNLKEYGITVECRYFDYCSPEDQLHLIDELEQIGIDALIIVPLESDEIVSRLKSLSDSGIPVILLNSEVSGFKPMCYIGSDYYIGGKTAAGLMCAFNKRDRLNVLLLNGSTYLSSHRLRKSGFLDELRELAPDANIIESADITNDPEYAHSVAVQLLSDYPNANAVYTIPDNTAAVAGAIRELGKAGSIVHIGFALTDATRPCILDGSVSALIGQRAEIQGKMPFEILLDYFATSTLPADSRYLMLNDIFIKQNAVF